MSIIPIDSTENPYAHDKCFSLVSKQELQHAGRAVQKLTYHDSRSMLFKIGQVAIALLMTLATLCISLCFLKGRNLWTTALANFKGRIIYLKVFENRVTVSPATYPIPSGISATVAPVKISLPVPQPVPINPRDAELQIKKEKILKFNPHWKPIVESWKGILIADQVWMLHVFELRQFGLSILPIDHIVGNDKRALVGSTLFYRLLEYKPTIEKILFGFIEINLSNRGLSYCSEAICLLPNLMRLNLSGNQLTEVPDLSGFPLLEVLILSSNLLTVAPNIKKNVNLRFLYLSENEIKDPPDTSENCELRILDLSSNKLTSGPDLRKNRILEQLYLSSNQITAPPDLSNNIHLMILNISENKLTAPPVVKKNIFLSQLILGGNTLRKSPYLVHNLNLTVLELSKNEIEVIPTLICNSKLVILNISDNKLSEESKTILKGFCKLQPSLQLTL